MKTFSIKKADIVLFICLLVVALASVFIFAKTAADDSVVEITVDGKVYAVEKLSEDKTIEVESSDGFNRVEIKDGRVCVSDADCHGKDCVQFGWIEKEGQVILCLPHKMIVTIIGGGEIDAVVY